MAGRVEWHGDTLRLVVEGAMARRIKAACIFLQSQVKQDIGQSGTLVYRVLKKDGTPGKKTKTVYNFTHSRPGNPPFKQTGDLQRSITHEVVGLVGRVGTNLPYGRRLELGDEHLAPRPYLRANLIRHSPTLTKILTGTIRPGELPDADGSPSRSGHLGAGAKAAGY